MIPYGRKFQMRVFKVLIYLIALLLMLAFAPMANAFNLDIGMDYLSGNDKSLSYMLGAGINLGKDVSLTSRIRHTEFNDRTIKQQGFIRASCDPEITKVWALWFYEQFGYDQVKKIELEHFIGGGVKYIVHESDKTKYSLSGGYVKHSQRLRSPESTNDVHRWSCRLKVKSRSKYFTLFGSEMSAVLFYQPNIEDFDDYLVTGELSFFYDLLKTVRVKLAVEDYYNSVPTVGQENEFLTSLSLCLSF